jgi:hypothetical protein
MRYGYFWYGSRKKLIGIRQIETIVSEEDEEEEAAAAAAASSMNFTHLFYRPVPWRRLVIREGEEGSGTRVVSSDAAGLALMGAEGPWLSVLSLRTLTRYWQIINAMLAWVGVALWQGCFVYCVGWSLDHR